ncbi:MAG: hypothetical protein MI919_08090 [Holophagales bacterium]|nr:hypothetical protein [Holophagales bacterium]
MFRISTVRRMVSLSVLLALLAAPAMARPAADEPELVAERIELAVRGAVGGLIAWFANLGPVIDPNLTASRSELPNGDADPARGSAAGGDGDGEDDGELGLGPVIDPNP